MLRKLAHLVLFGNYYLALCIVALSAETGFKNHFVLTDFTYYLFLFLSVVVYYTYAYIGDRSAIQSSNPRTRWYASNRAVIFFTQVFYTIIIAACIIMLAYRYQASFFLFTVKEWLLLFVFPFVALLYYGVIFPAGFKYKLRNIAWLKPFIIGFVCTGIIVVYPLLFHGLQSGKSLYLSATAIHYFITNWLFTTAIAIMFDIKDFAADHNIRLQTFVVKKGLRYTLFFILFPIAAASYISFLFFAFAQRFSFLSILINTIPFFLLLIAAASLRRRKGILYYLVVIDGLLLLKAVFGITAMLLLE